MYVTDEEPPEFCPVCNERRVSAVVEADGPGTHISGDYCEDNETGRVYLRRWYIHG